ncbi:MAG: phosphorylase [Proteobacteria bacterium]|nr:phosphorylase [Pseudomonadota bacterium]MBU1060119.1 phosphorylase [Pseudomonadota bacterium]
MNNTVNKIKDGHGDDILIHPVRGRNEKAIPPLGLFFVNPQEARMALDHLLKQGGERRFLFHSGLVVSPGNGFFVAGPAVGAPMAVMALEKLIVLGATTVIMNGWCGAIKENLRVGDTLLGGVAHSGEGTSGYYSTETISRPSPVLLRHLQKSMGAYTPFPIWSTDAPYRESRHMLAVLAQTHDLGGVDMEYSALCTVAAFRGIAFSGLFLVSDELWNREWKPGFTGKAFKQKSKAQVEMLIDYVQLLVSEEEK